MVRQRKTQRKAVRSNFYKALHRLKTLKPSERQQAMNMANDSFIRQFCKHLKSLQRARLPRKKAQSLRKYKKQLRQLVNSKTSLSKRRHILTQKGGGMLTTVLSFIPVVGPLINAIDRLTKM